MILIHGLKSIFPRKWILQKKNPIHSAEKLMISFLLKYGLIENRLTLLEVGEEILTEVNLNRNQYLELEKIALGAYYPLSGFRMKTSLIVS